MVAHTTVDELREELLRSGDDLGRRRQEAVQLLREIAKGFDASRDCGEPGDASVAWTVTEKQEAITARDKARREKLQRQLNGV